MIVYVMILKIEKITRAYDDTVPVAAQTRSSGTLAIILRSFQTLNREPPSSRHSREESAYNKVVWTDLICYTWKFIIGAILKQQGKIRS